MKYVFPTEGICPSKIEIETNGDTVGAIQFNGGCNGNGKGIAALVNGMQIEDVINRCENITCGRKSSSCPAQLAKALRQIREYELSQKTGR